MTSLEAAINNLNDKEIPTSLGAQSLVVIINTIRPETVSSSPSHNAARTGKSVLCVFYASVCVCVCVCV